MPRPRLLLILAFASALAAVAVYSVALGTGRGLNADNAGMLTGWDGLAFTPAHQAVFALIKSIDRATLIAAATLLAAVALVRGRIAQALAAVLAIGGAILTTEYLKSQLGTSDPLGGEPIRLLHGSFPSGHATIALSIGLGLVLVVPAEARLLAAMGGAVYAATVGVGLVAVGAHYPSDVLGGFLVAFFWAALAAAILSTQPDWDQGREISERFAAETRALGVAVALMGAVVAAALVVTHAHELGFYGGLHTTFFVAAAAIGAAAVLLAGVLAAALGGLSRAGPAPRA